MQKARRHHTRWLRPLVGAWFQGLFHSSVRGAFHLSLTVLVRYRSLGSIQPCGMVPADSDGIPRVPPYSGAAPVLSACRVPASHRLRGRVPSPSATLPGFLWTVLQPRHAPKRRRFGLVPVRSPLLGESFLLSFPAGTKMFQFPAFASALTRMSGSLPTGCPIRTSAGHGAFATRRSFSQLVTSFFASESPGIPHAPFWFRYIFLCLAAGSCRN